MSTVMHDEPPAALAARIRLIWPAFSLGLGLLATMALIAVLGWLLFQVALSLT